MLHAFYIEARINVGDIDRQVARQKLRMLIANLGGEKLTRQSIQVKKISRVGRRVKLVMMHRFDGKGDGRVIGRELVRAIRRLGDVSLRVRYHACRHDEHEPCSKWRTVLDES